MGQYDMYLQYSVNYTIFCYEKIFYSSKRSKLINNSREFFSSNGDSLVGITFRNGITMKYDKFWIFCFFLVIAIWLLVLGSTLKYLIFSENVLVNSDIDLSIPTLIMMIVIVLYLFLGIFIYIVYLLKIGEIKRKHMKTITSKVTGYDKCSIIIPARDEESVIRRAVLRCLEQTYKNIEVLVIAHNSTDRTSVVAQVEDSRVRVFNLRTKEAGKSIALNYGIEQSKGQYILVLDADAVMANDFIEKALPMFDGDSCVAVQGRVLPINRKYNFLTRMMAMEDDLWSEPILTVRATLGKRCPLLGTGFIINKKMLIEAGMFTNSLVDDYELSFRLFRKKYRILFAPFSKCYAEEPPSLEVMFRQRARWGRGFINCLKYMVAEPRDILGSLLWFMPVGTFLASVMFFIVGYATIFNLIFEYVPFKFTYLPLGIWFLVTGIVLGFHTLVLLRVHGRNFFRHACYLLPFIVFSQYGLVILYKALFVRTWGTTKTQHGFMSETPSNETIISVQQGASKEITKSKLQSFWTSSVDAVNTHYQALKSEDRTWSL